jgi:hypothetical protein
MLKQFSSSEPVYEHVLAYILDGLYLFILLMQIVLLHRNCVLKNNTVYQVIYDPSYLTITIVIYQLLLLILRRLNVYII